MMLLGLAAPHPSAMLLGYGGGLGGDPDCASVVSSMAVGQTCNLPDGSNIATWDGSHLTNPAGGPIDAINAAALVAAGWPAAQINGGAGTANQNATASGAASGQPWWSTALTALTKGVTQGAITPPTGTLPTTPVVAPPWYSTPLGIGGILAALGLAWYLFKK